MSLFLVIVAIVCFLVGALAVLSGVKAPVSLEVFLYLGLASLAGSLIPWARGAWAPRA